MFLNQHHHSFDDKGRLTIPAKFRELLVEDIYVLQGLDRNLMVMPPASYQILYDRVMSMNLADPDARLLRRIMLGNAMHLIPDGSGRILLTQNLKDYAGLKDNVVFVGQGDYFEIWADEPWQEQESQINDTETNAARLAKLDIRTR
jgi:MraZ protein